MGKIHKITKNGETIYPCSITDAIVNPKTKKTVTEELTLLDNKINRLEGFENKALDLLWEAGYTDLTGAKVLGGGYGKFVSTTSVLLDNYDKLTFTLTNVNSILPASSGVSILLTKEGEDPIKLAYSETSIICSNYPGYTAHFNQQHADSSGGTYDLPVIYATKKGIEIDVDKELSEESDNAISNRAVSEKFNELGNSIYGFENKELDLLWEAGYTDLTGAKVSDSSWNKFISTTSVLLDNYDKLTFTLTNVNSILPASRGVTLLLTKEGEEPIKIAYTEISLICSDYKGYTAHFNQRTQDAEPPIIYATKNSELKKVITLDDELSSSSENPVKNKVIYGKIEDIKTEISDIKGFENKALDLLWEAGYTDLTGAKVLGGGYGKFVSTTSVLLDNYDKLTFTLTNVNSILPASSGVSILLTKEGEDPIKLAYSETSIICSNYSGYTAHFNQQHADSSGGTYDLPVIYATKNSILSGGSSSVDADEIVCDGDSLTNNYPAELQKYAVGYTVKKCQMGSETSIANLCRMGGLQFVNTAPITIPASGATDPFPVAGRWLTSENTYAKLSFANLSQSSTTLNGAIVNGIKGAFSKITSQAKGLVIYNSSDTVIKTFDTIADIELSTLSDAAYCKITINNPYVNEPHLSLDDNAQDVISLCTQDGYIGSDGVFVSDTSFKCSDKIMLTGVTKIYADGLATSEGYVFTREESGEEIKLGKHSIFTAGNREKYKNSIHIVFTGQNGGYDNEEDFVAQIKTATTHLTRFIIVSTWSARTTEKLNKLMIAAFGNRYVNLREYMINQSVLDAIRLGLVDSGSNVNDWQTLFIGDGTHPNTNGNILWAVLFWNTLVELGFAEGERIINASQIL